MSNTLYFSWSAFEGSRADCAQQIDVKLNFTPPSSTYPFTLTESTLSLIQLHCIHSTRGAPLLVLVLKTTQRYLHVPPRVPGNDVGTASRMVRQTSSPQWLMETAVWKDENSLDGWIMVRAVALKQVLLSATGSKRSSQHFPQI